MRDALEAAADHVAVLISDNGRGFEPAALTLPTRAPVNG